jgi:hypothetical protein
LVPSKRCRRATRRVASVDALRGFTMFWIIGADGATKALAEIRKRHDPEHGRQHYQWAIRARGVGGSASLTVSVNIVAMAHSASSARERKRGIEVLPGAIWFDLNIVIP